MRKTLGYVLAAVLAVGATAAAAAEADSLAATADRIAQTMMESPPDDMTEAEIALAFGWMHLFGMLGDANPVRAEDYLRQAMDNGLPEAGVILGAMYFGNAGIPGTGERDVATAMDYFTRAAEHDCVDALRMLGVIYTEGEDGVDPDPDKAAHYLRRAAELGSDIALDYLQPQIDEAAAWEAANPGQTAEFPSSREALVDAVRAAEAKIRSNRVSTVTARAFDILSERLSEDDAARLAAAASKALDQGEADIWGKMEQAIEDGVAELIDSQPTEAKQGDAALIIGIFHYMGLLNGYDPDRARVYLEMALDKGVPEAGVTLGELYLGMTREDGDDADVEKGLQYLKTAAEQDNVDAQRVLGFIYADGRDGIEPDPALAEQYFRAAARHGDELSLARLGEDADVEIDQDLVATAEARRAELEAMIDQVNSELERLVLEAMGGDASGQDTNP